MNCKAFFPFVLLVITATFGAPESGSTPDSDFRHLVGFFQGQWQCAGHFANGAAILSEEAFEPLLGGVWLQEIHSDRPPFSYRAYSVWGVDNKSHELTLTIHDNFGGVRIFTSPDWRPPSITFDTSPILGHAGRKERFVYVQTPPGSFSFEYELETDSGQWKMGDHVDCKKTR
jgi:hypothetical protein